MRVFSECCEPCCPGEAGTEQPEQQLHPGQLPPGSRLVSGTIAQQGEPRYLEPLVQVRVLAQWTPLPAFEYFVLWTANKNLPRISDRILFSSTFSACERLRFLVLAIIGCGMPRFLAYW